MQRFDSLGAVLATAIVWSYSTAVLVQGMPEKFLACEGHTANIAYDIGPNKLQEALVVAVEQITPIAGHAYISKARTKHIMTSDKRLSLVWETNKTDGNFGNFLYGIQNVSKADHGLYRVYIIYNGHYSSDDFHLHGAGCPNSSLYSYPEIIYRKNATAGLFDGDKIVLETGESIMLEVTIPAADPPVKCTIQTNQTRHVCSGRTKANAVCVLELSPGLAFSYTVTVTFSFVDLPPSTRRIRILVNECRSCLSPEAVRHTGIDNSLSKSATLACTPSVFVLIIMLIIASVRRIARD